MMRTFLVALSMIVAPLHGLSPALAAPATADVAPADGPLAIPFDPPIGQKLRYRWEKSDEKRGKPRLSWEIYDATFQKAGDGYHLTITPVDGGTDGEKSAPQIAFEKKIQDLTKRPFIVEVTKDGTIGNVIDEAKFWAEIATALNAAIAESANDTERKALQFVEKMFGDMTPEAKTSLLIKDLQPLVEFAAVDLEEAADVLPFEFETESAFGTKMMMEGTISVLGVDDEVAAFSLVSRIAPDGMKKATAELLGKLPVEQAKKADVDSAVSALKQIRHETRSKYVVSRNTGVLLEFSSDEEISVDSDDGSDHKISTRTLTLID